ncbi:MAG TPA: FkbM family methyltransferase [Isosphaeraceae bacterium]|nr:FkbM family methyltransferase [Isosphaeraceae bacterium]
MSILIDKCIEICRPIPIRGKATLFHRFVPHEGTRTIKVSDGFLMELDLQNAQHRMIFMGCFSPHIASVVRALVPEGGVFLDVGANVGYFSLLGHGLVGSRGRVVAVEPTPSTCETLRANIERNGFEKIELNPIALGDENTSLRLYMPPAAEHRDFNVTTQEAEGWTPVDVSCRRLDDVLKEWNVERVDLMKIDVEGFEPKVFAGGEESLKSGVIRHLITEVNGYRLTHNGVTPRQYFDQIESLGFRHARLSHGRAVPSPVKEQDLDPNGESDLLFVHQSV